MAETRAEPSHAVIIDSEIENYQRDGVTLLPQLLGPEWVKLLRAGVEHNRRHPSPWAHWYTNPDQSIGFWSDYVTWRDVPEYERVVRESGLARVAAQLMRSDTARFFHEHVLVKEPGASERTPWHHDQPYYCVDGDQSVSMWIALDHVAAKRSPRFLVGSHRWNRWFIPRKFIDHTPYAAESGRYELLPDIDAMIDADPDQHRTVSFRCDPGDVIAFHFRTLHDAPANDAAASRRRRAVSLRWVGDDAIWAERPWQVSPPFEPDGLRPGDPLDGDRFPVIHPC